MDLNKLASILWDLALIVGAAAFIFGLHLAWRPLGYIVGGLLLMAAAALNQYGSAREQRLTRLRPGTRAE